MSGLDREECKKLKAKRRTLKNRGYAASCRHKRDNEEGDLQGEKMELEVDIMRDISTYVLDIRHYCAHDFGLGQINLVVV